MRTATTRSRSVIAEWAVSEHFGIDWNEQAVHVDLDAPTTREVARSPTPLSVIDESGREVAAQLVSTENDSQVWYLAALRPHERKSYRLRRGGDAADRSLGFTADGELLELRNESFAVRLSWIDQWQSGGKAGDAPLVRSFQNPKPLGELPGPMQAVRGPDGVWFGTGSWRGHSMCRGFRCEILE